MTELPAAVPRLDIELSWPGRAAARAGITEQSRARSNRHAEQIVEAALRLTWQKGSAFTIHELAKEAGVSLQTFYRYFAGKDELILAVIEQRIAEACVAFNLGARHEPDPVQRLRSYVVTAIAGLDGRASPAARRFISSEHFRLQEAYPDELAQATAAFARLLIPDVEAATEAGQLAPGDAEQNAWFVNRLVMTTFHHYAFASAPPPDDLADQLWSFCHRALGGRTDEAVGRPNPAEDVMAGLIAATRWATGIVRGGAAAVRMARPK